MKKSLMKNYFYNLSYQILVVLTPFITIPYLARVLGPESIGLASFSSSIVSYFSLFASLGIGLYGQREIAYRQDDPKGRSKTFFELTLLRLVLMLLSLTAPLSSPACTTEPSSCSKASTSPLRFLISPGFFRGSRNLVRLQPETSCSASSP